MRNILVNAAATFVVVALAAMPVPPASATVVVPN